MRKCDFQRIFDINLSLILILILLPLFLIVSIILFFTGEGYIFYFQKRIGKNKKSFRIIKFATMLKNSPDILSGDITLFDDPRILKFGKYLRLTKINELPQLLNILAGQMSFIGPRPLTIKNFQMYSLEAQLIITSVRPGLSGVGSIIFKNEHDILKNKTNPIDFYKKNIANYKANLEFWYIKNYSLSLYFILIFITIFEILFPKFKLLRKIYPEIPNEPENLRDL